MGGIDIFHIIDVQATSRKQERLDSLLATRILDLSLSIRNASSNLLLLARFKQGPLDARTYPDLGH